MEFTLRCAKLTQSAAEHILATYWGDGLFLPEKIVHVKDTYEADRQQLIALIKADKPVKITVKLEEVEDEFLSPDLIAKKHAA